jgi:hypothetical protein
VRNLNILIKLFPSNLIAKAFQFRQEEFFELDDPADRAGQAYQPIWYSGSSWHDHGVSGLGNDLGSSLSNALSTSSTAPGSSSGSGGGGGGF